MTVWTVLAAAGMLMWAICLALAMAPLWDGAARRKMPSPPHSWLA